MKQTFEPDLNFIRSHLPMEFQSQPIACFSNLWIDGRTVLHEGERGGPDIVVYQAENREDLLLWQLEQVCHFLKEPVPAETKTWRYQRDRTENGHWVYIEHCQYEYNAIEDPRLAGFESFLRILRHCDVPEERWELAVQK